ncbi:engulfment and cell motility elm family protein [Plasmopara halstedii]|uniref:Engulfment and cell motility elm family protein n=1 Tax=Plasmopara halstedii TaxID=4781 RepID=A0A0P1AZ20_PLAHL|nr:engulfment and cell motility elm family protein [Plasmopara halstedii]CEG47040.1 engulfment and cell motility elm family protein [Plasmopara halstedii]|eukprot:XP_024583409.1 engulfment and cell motility elm family protein [Plasmopara halstedii]
MDDHVSDDLLWSLDHLIKQDTSADVENDTELVRASFYTQDNMLGCSRIGSDLVFGRRNTVRLSRDNDDTLVGYGRLTGLMGYGIEEDELDDAIDCIEERIPATLSSVHPSSSRHSISQHSISEETDRSLSFASDGGLSVGDISASSPARTRSTRRLSDGDQSTYEQRIEASLAGYITKSLNVESRYMAESQPDRTFTMDDLALFDSQFGREIYLERLAQSLQEQEGEKKSLASYRKSTMQRISTPVDITRQGWIMKRGDLVPSYRKRWFVLRQMPQGPMLTYAKDDHEGSPTKVIDLSSTSRCIVATGKNAKEHEFKVITSADSSRREFYMVAASSYDMTQWVCAIQNAINSGNRSTFDGASDFQQLWHDAGIQGFLVRYGVRKCSSRNRLQTRVLELNFAEQTLTNSRRGETLKTFHFTDIRSVSVSNVLSRGEEHGIIIEYRGRHRSWPIFLDTVEARDDLYTILQRIVDNVVSGDDLEKRSSRLTLKTGHLETKNAGPHATLRGRMLVCLHENCIMFYPADGDTTTTRPWYVTTLKGLRLAVREEKRLLYIGRMALACSSAAESRDWYKAISAAMCLPLEIIEIELKERAKIRAAFQSCVCRLRKLLKAKVTPEPSGPPRDQKTVDLMISKLWELVFPEEPFKSNNDPRWLEIGFQRGGPASDLRSSGLLGLYCLIFFASYPSSEFQRILMRTRHGVSEGNMKNYPLAIACINVASLLTETLGIGDAGTHSKGCSPSAMKTYSLFIAQCVSTTRCPDSVKAFSSSWSLSHYECWDDIMSEPVNHVFETIFCLLFPVLDSLFVEMGAGYMEFGQVMIAFRQRIIEIFNMQPKSLKELQTLANEPCTGTLIVPTVLTKQHKIGKISMGKKIVKAGGM